MVEVEKHDVGEFDTHAQWVRVSGAAMTQGLERRVRTGRYRFRVWTTGGDSWSGSQRGVLIGVNANCSSARSHAGVS